MKKKIASILVFLMLLQSSFPLLFNVSLAIEEAFDEDTSNETNLETKEENVDNIENSEDEIVEEFKLENIEEIASEEESLNNEQEFFNKEQEVEETKEETQEETIEEEEQEKTENLAIEETKVEEEKIETPIVEEEQLLEESMAINEVRSVMLVSPVTLELNSGTTITFKDDNLGNALLEKFDTNSDGKLTEAEVEAVTTAENWSRILDLREKDIHNIYGLEYLKAYLKSTYIYLSYNNIAFNEEDIPEEYSGDIANVSDNLATINSLREDRYGVRFGGQYLDLTIENVPFEDEGLKAQLVRNYDTNGDGELSVKEMQSVTSVSNCTYFFGNSSSLTFTKLGGLEYAGNLRELNYFFENTDELEKLKKFKYLEELRIGAYVGSDLNAQTYESSSTLNFELDLNVLKDYVHLYILMVSTAQAPGVTVNWSGLEHVPVDQLWALSRHGQLDTLNAEMDGIQTMVLSPIFFEETDYETIDRLPNLELLYIRGGTSLNGISCLHHLKNLELYYFGEHSTEEISYLAGGLESLETLRLSLSDLDDLSMLVGLSSLEYLEISCGYRYDTLGADYESLSALTGLVELDFTANLTDVSFIKNLTNLQKLRLYNSTYGIEDYYLDEGKLVDTLENLSDDVVVILDGDFYVNLGDIPSYSTTIFSREDLGALWTYLTNSENFAFDPDWNTGEFDDYGNVTIKTNRYSRWYTDKSAAARFIGPNDVRFYFTFIYKEVDLAIDTSNEKLIQYLLENYDTNSDGVATVTDLIDLKTINLSNLGITDISFLCPEYRSVNSTYGYEIDLSFNQIDFTEEKNKNVLARLIDDGRGYGYYVKINGQFADTDIEYIPFADPNLKQYMLENYCELDRNEDGEISLAEVKENWDGYLIELDLTKFTSLKGLEYFEIEKAVIYGGREDFDASSLSAICCVSELMCHGLLNTDGFENFVNVTDLVLRRNRW